MQQKYGGLIDLDHAALTDGGEDFVVAEYCAGIHGQWLVRSGLRSLGAVYNPDGLDVHGISAGGNRI